jgi:hypothetical protein
LKEEKEVKKSKEKDDKEEKWMYTRHRGRKLDELNIHHPEIPYQWYLTSANDCKKAPWTHDHICGNHWNVYFDLI